MKFMACLLALVVGCGSTNASAPEPPSFSKDSGSDSAMTELPPVGNYDSGLGPEWCESKIMKPTAYSNLFERDCVDSNGVATFNDYYDRNLSIYCNWNTTSDLLTRCIPNNWQSSPEYAYDNCTSPIGLDQSSPDGGSDTGYLGIEQYTDGGSYIVVHAAGDRYTGSNPVYYKLLDRATNTWSCESTYIKLTGINLFFVGAVVDPTIFTLKKSNVL